MVSRRIIKAILQRYPTAQAIYLFGSYGTPDEWADSDVDIALLLPHRDAKQAGSLALTDLHLALEDMLQRSVDLINLRRVSTVLQKEVVGEDLNLEIVSWVITSGLDQLLDFTDAVLDHAQQET